MIQNAKDLISKGKELNDEDLIKMGMDLLRLYDKTEKEPETQESSNQTYECQNCGHIMNMDKPNRKQCPKCKKHKLKLTDVQQNNFVTQPKNSRNKRKIVFKNTWNDDKTECFDEEDARLKKITKPSARNRPTVKMVDVKCNNCGKIEKVHPIHAPIGEGRSLYVCNKCIRNKKVY